MKSSYALIGFQKKECLRTLLIIENIDTLPLNTE